MEKIGNNIFDIEKEHFHSKRMVVKIGSSTVFDQQTGINTAFIASMAEQAAKLYTNGTESLFVCSGSVAVGQRVGRARNNAAAIGQAKLTAAWTYAFQERGIDVLQFLFSERDLVEEGLEDLLRGAMSEGAVIVNGNDAVRNTKTASYSLIANNDGFAGFIAQAVGADTLLLLTDVVGVLDERQMLTPSITRLEDVLDVLEGKSTIGTGGMITKCRSALEFVRPESDSEAFKYKKRAYIASGREENVLINAARGINVGTGFTQQPMLY